MKSGTVKVRYHAFNYSAKLQSHEGYKKSSKMLKLFKQ